jgi:hypothetical protein
MLIVNVSVTPIPTMFPEKTVTASFTPIAPGVILIKKDKLDIIERNNDFRYSTSNPKTLNSKYNINEETTMPNEDDVNVKKIIFLLFFISSHPFKTLTMFNKNLFLPDL